MGSCGGQEEGGYKEGDKVGIVEGRRMDIIRRGGRRREVIREGRRREVKGDDYVTCDAHLWLTAVSEDGAR